MSDKFPSSRVQSIADTTGFVRKNMPIKYLGCHLFVGRKKISYSMEVVHKMERGSYYLLEVVLFLSSMFCKAFICIFSPSLSLLKLLSNISNQFLQISFGVKLKMKISITGLSGKNVVILLMKAGWVLEVLLICALLLL